MSAILFQNPAVFCTKFRINSSLRSKRFRRVFRPFEAFFAFWRRKNWGEGNTDGSSGKGEGRREKETFLPSPPPSRTFLRSPQFSRVQEAKNASNLRKALRKRLLRRLHKLLKQTTSQFVPCCDPAWEI